VKFLPLALSDKLRCFSAISVKSRDKGRTSPTVVRWGGRRREEEEEGGGEGTVGGGRRRGRRG